MRYTARCQPGNTKSYLVLFTYSRRHIRVNWTRTRTRLLILTFTSFKSVVFLIVLPMSDDETQLASPPPKRRKMSVGGSGTIQSPFWLPDGDFILRVENINFKIHRSRLQCSVIFCDCLALPQPANGDCIDGCPFVELVDSANDWLVTLKWIYDQE
jgi:hypothetical protein